MGVSSPSGFPTPDGFSMVSEGEDHSLALSAGGGVFAWGSNEFGQLGDGSFDSAVVPVDITQHFIKEEVVDAELGDLLYFHVDGMG